VVIEGKLISKDDKTEIQIDTETYSVIKDASNGLSSKLKPGTVKVKGIVQNEDDKNLSGNWKIRLTEIL